MLQLRFFSFLFFFFLSHQLFDEENPVHKSGTKYMFTTEGHIVSVDKHLRESPWKEFFSEDGGQDQEGKSVPRPKSPELKVINSSSNVSGFLQRWFLCGRGENNTNWSFRVPDRRLVAHLDWVV